MKKTLNVQIYGLFCRRVSDAEKSFYKADTRRGSAVTPDARNVALAITGAASDVAL